MKRPLTIRTPRQLLVVLGVILFAIGVQTYRYPPDFLTFSDLWCALAILASISCLLAAIRPRRLYVATSGATVVTVAGGRGIALALEVATEAGSAEIAAGFIVGALIWSVAAMLSYVVWREFVLPWSIGAN